MKAVCLEKPGSITIKEAKMKMPAQGEALLKIYSAGICGSDIGAFRGTNSLVSYPRIIGHELGGRIIEISRNNKKGLKPGDKVAVDPYLYCGNCYPCSIGRTNCCTDLKVLGVHVDGGMAEIFAHPADMLVKVPEDMPWELVSMAEPLTIGLHGIHRLGVKAGEHVAIFGAGTIGLLAAFAAREYGAIPVLIDVVEERLEFARKMGIPFTINSVRTELIPEIMDITGGRGTECIMEASGSNEAIRSSLDIVSYAGRIAFTGWPKSMTELPTDMITKKELDIRGARTSAGEFEEAVELIHSGRIDAGALISRTISLEQVPEIMADMEKNPGKYLKVVVLM